MLTLQKLPNDPEVWKEYAAAGLVWEQHMHSPDARPTNIPVECWYRAEEGPDVFMTSEDVQRFHWKAASWRYGILLED